MKHPCDDDQCQTTPNIRTVCNKIHVWWDAFDCVFCETVPNFCSDPFSLYSQAPRSQSGL